MPITAQPQWYDPDDGTFAANHIRQRGPIQIAKWTVSGDGDSPAIYVGGARYLRVYFGAETGDVTALNIGFKAADPSDTNATAESTATTASPVTLAASLGTPRAGWHRAPSAFVVLSASSYAETGSSSIEVFLEVHY